MKVKASEFRKDLFTLLDKCLESGEEIEIPRKGGMVLVSAVHQRIRIADLPLRPGRVFDGDSLDRYSPAEWNA